MDSPKYTPIQTGVITSDMDAKLFHTYARLITLAWQNDFKRTDWLSEGDLVSAIGLDWSTIKRHIAALKLAGLVAWDTDRKNGKRFFILELRLAKGAKGRFCAPSSGGSINIEISQTEGPLLPAKAQNCALPSGAPSSGPRPASDILDPDAWQALREAGVGEPVRTRLSNLPTVTAWYIRAHAAQAKRDGVKIGALIHRIENDWPAPDWCEQCDGLDGQHAGDCPTQAERRAAEAIAEAAERERLANLPQPPVPPPMSVEMVEADAIWLQTLRDLQMQLAARSFSELLRSTAVVGREENGAFVVGVHTSSAQEILDRRLRPMIERAIADVAGHPIHLRFVVDAGHTTDLRSTELPLGMR